MWLKIIICLISCQIYANCLDNIQIYKDTQINYFNPISDTTNPVYNGEFNISTKLIKHGNTFFDIGANVGQYTNKVSESFNNLKIYSFEPIPEIYFQLKKNVKHLNNNKIKLYNFAISKSQDIKEFNFYQNISGISGLYYHQHYTNIAGQLPKKIKVKCQTLDNFCINNKITFIDYLKIDTEGSDFHVLLGAKKLLMKHKIKFIQFEYTDAYQASKSNLYMTLKYLSSFGYTIFKILPDGLLHISKWDKTLENYLYSNYLAVSPKEDTFWPRIQLQ